MGRVRYELPVPGLAKIAALGVGYVNGRGNDGISIVCREVDKRTGEIATYLCKNNVSDADLFHVGIRAKVNPELMYFAVRTCVAEDQEQLEDLLRFLKRKRLSARDTERYGGVVRL